jgi:hypothetical protein
MAKKRISALDEILIEDLTVGDYFIPVDSAGDSEAFALSADDLISLVGVTPSVAWTSDDTLTADDLDSLNTNEGASATVTLTLPAATEGLYGSFSRQEDEAFRLAPATGENFLGKADDKYLEIASYGDVEIYCYTAGTWTVIRGGASWLYEA